MLACDLVIDREYTGKQTGPGQLSDPLNELLAVSSRGGFRFRGSSKSANGLDLVVLTTRFNDPDWPDEIDHENGRFIYFGDNKHPGRGLHNTPRGGNRILKHLFDRDIADTDPLERFPPVFAFSHTGPGRMKFLGLLVPGTPETGARRSLTAIWRTSGEERFQNYRAVFSILDVNTVDHRWVSDIREGRATSSPYAPAPWLAWLRSNEYQVLRSPRTINVRTKQQQLPADNPSRQILDAVYSQFDSESARFELCAEAIARLLLPNITRTEITPPMRDGGRDVLGDYQLGGPSHGIKLQFALEAKCYRPGGGGVNTQDVMRLIARLKHRQFGMLITTNYISRQAYSEIREDEHPVILVSGRDIAEVLRREIGDITRIEKWLDKF